jgi:hypothetical protein
VAQILKTNPTDKTARRSRFDAGLMTGLDSGGPLPIAGDILASSVSISNDILVAARRRAPYCPVIRPIKNDVTITPFPFTSTGPRSRTM